MPQLKADVLFVAYFILLNSDYDIFRSQVFPVVLQQNDYVIWMFQAKCNLAQNFQNSEAKSFLNFSAKNVLLAKQLLFLSKLRTYF